MLYAGEFMDRGVVAFFARLCCRMVALRLSIAVCTDCVEREAAWGDGRTSLALVRFEGFSCSGSLLSSGASRLRFEFMMGGSACWWMVSTEYVWLTTPPTWLGLLMGSGASREGGSEVSNVLPDVARGASNDLKDRCLVGFERRVARC